MNIVQVWMHTPLARTLAWSLVHFLWEGAAIAIVLAALLLLARRDSARIRYAIACLAMLAMPVAFGITFAILFPKTHVHLRLPLAPPPEAGALASGGASSPLKTPDRLTWLGPIWMAGVLLFYLRSLGGWVAAQRLRRTGVCLAAADWQSRVDRWRQRLRLTRPVMLLESCLVDSPVVIGLLRPAILMPVGLLAGLPADLLESIVIHELAHICRRDYLVNLLQSFVEGLLFYHPAVWWVSRTVRAERENCCDDVVVALKGDARAYAVALARLEQNRSPEFALAAAGGSLMKRIHRLIQEQEAPRTAVAPLVATGLLIVSVGVAVAGWPAKPVSAPKPVAAPQMVPVAEPAGVLLSGPNAKPVPVLVAQVRAAPPAPQLAPPTPDQKVDSPYRHWLNEDVAYIITDRERAAFKALQSDAEREHFIEQFWLVRDPTPNTPENEFKEEHYRRIAYANEHYASQIPGWKTDRGRVYITYGPPDEIESHPSGGSYQKPPQDGGGTVTTVPFEQWLYHTIEGIGTNVIIEFVDPQHNGEYRMTADPLEKEVAAAAANGGGAHLSIDVQRLNGLSLVQFPLTAFGDHRVQISVRILTVAVDALRGTVARQTVASDEATIQGPAALYSKFFSLPAGTFRMNILVKDLTTGRVSSDSSGFDVK